MIHDYILLEIKSVRNRAALHQGALDTTYQSSSTPAPGRASSISETPSIEATTSTTIWTQGATHLQSIRPVPSWALLFYMVCHHHRYSHLLRPMVCRSLRPEDCLPRREADLTDRRARLTDMVRVAAGPQRAPPLQDPERNTEKEKDDGCGCCVVM